MVGPGQDPGHGGGGLPWSALVDHLVAEHGSLAAVARVLAAERGYSEQIESIERALRRLRSRDGQEGGAWGARLLRAFGLPRAVVDRVRWMGLYHSRFTDLPVSMGLELLRPWERPPVSESDARVWLLLARASLMLRRRERDAADEALAQAERALRRADAAATVEWCLVRAFRAGRTHSHEVPGLLDRAEAGLARVEDAGDRACFRARLVDQRAYPLNRPAPGEVAAHAAAYALYEGLPDEGPAFARCRRANGLAWSAYQLGRVEEAVAWARESVEHAGDSGSLRLRAMALSGLARFLGEASVEGQRARARSLDIAQRLEDEALWGRFGGGR